MNLLVYKTIFAILLAVSLLTACKKDKVPTVTSPAIEKSKFELIPGEYRMYDTLGNYLGYDLTISHWFGINNEGFRKDTFLFENFDGQFSFTELQSDANIINWPKYYFHLGHHQPLYDSMGKRWIGVS